MPLKGSIGLVIWLLLRHLKIQMGPRTLSEFRFWLLSNLIILPHASFNTYFGSLRYIFLLAGDSSGLVRRGSSDSGPRPPPGSAQPPDCSAHWPEWWGQATPALARPHEQHRPLGRGGVSLQQEDSPVWLPRLWQGDTPTLSLHIKMDRKIYKI